MKICLKQMPVSMDNAINLQKLTDVPDCDMLILSEMWNCPYHNDALKHANLRHDESLQAMLKLSKEKQIWIIGGSICANTYNRCYILYNGNIIDYYDKTHLFEFHGHKDYTEKEIFTPGDHFTCFKTPWGKCGVLLCYDIRFSEVSRLLAKQGAKILFCPAAFNEQATKKHWKLFAQTRALENEVFFCGVAPAKYTYKSYTSFGHSIVVSPFGEILLEMDEKEHTQVIDIDLTEIEKARKRMPYWKIRRNDLYQLEEKNEDNTNQ